MVEPQDDDDPFDTYAVVINDEEQYSIWPTERTLPAGWRPVGKEGSKQECLTHIGEVWTDMRPLSLRKAMEEWAKSPPPAASPAARESAPPLVDRLSDGRHAVIFNCRPERSVQALRERIELGYVHLKFTETRGGTELGVRIDRSASDLAGADFDQGVGNVRLVGDLTLDYVKVRCVADLDVATLAGTGYLEKVAAGNAAAAS